jgi:hypothetical protein
MEAMMLKRIQVQSKSLLSRLGGFSLLGVGINFKAPEPDRVIVRDVITALEDKRALYASAVSEQPDYVVQSILQMRQELTSGLKRISDGSPAKEGFRTMRAACRDFLEDPAMKEKDQSPMLHNRGLWQQEEFLLGLGRLRSIFGQQLAELGYLYGVDIEPRLATILPPEREKAD